MKVWIKASIWIALLSVFVITGCQDILDDALKQDIELKESVVSDQTVTASTGSVPVVGSPVAVAKAGPVEIEGFSVFTADPSSGPVFTEMVKQNAVKLVGSVSNSNATSGTLKVLLGTVNTLVPPGQGTEIYSGAFTSGNATITIDQLVASTFFNTNPNIDPFYVYVYHDAAASITVNSLQFVTPAVAVLTHTVVHDEELMSKGDVESIIGAHIGGSITNHGAANVQIKVDLSDNNAGTSLSWETPSIMVETVAPGATLNLGDVTVSDTQLNDALSYLAETGDIVATITLSSTEDVNVDLASIELIGTATVIPN